MKTIKLKPNEFLTIEIEDTYREQIKGYEFVVNSDFELREINRTNKRTKKAAEAHRKMLELRFGKQNSKV